MLSSVVLVDCVIMICRCENGRGVFLFVVMGCVVWFGVCLLIVMVDCESVLYSVVWYLGDIWWCSFVVSVYCHMVVNLHPCCCLVGNAARWYG
jgi:hypothetical protein